FDVKDQPVTIIAGFHGWDAEYDEAGKEVQRQHVGKNGDILEPIGVGITQVLKNSNASRSELQSGDKIVTYNGKHPISIGDLLQDISEAAEDPLIGVVTVVIEREGEQLTKQVDKGKLGAMIITNYGRSKKDSDSFSKLLKETKP
ncbi:MAG: hypothetical protein P1V19_25710, partial [Gimesia sp.]|nr:hypothetical protein [Gimesia sp.]